jgi:diguanylate cyclase (GGDEF)-like protein/PAS domain S-box-containing protein
MAALPEARDAIAPAARRWTLLCVAVAAVTAGYALLLSTGVAGATGARDIANVGNAIISLTAAVACLIRERQQRKQRRGRWSWGFVGLGVLSWGLGQTAWVFYESVRGVAVPFPSSPDIGFLGLAPLTAIGLLMAKVARQSPAQRVRSVLDGLMIATSMLMVSWIVLIGPLVRLGGDGIGGYVILTYPINDVVIVTVVLYSLAVARRSRQALSRLMLVGAGMLTIAVADSGYAYLTLVSSYASGSVLDAGWFAGFGLILVAAAKPVSADPPGADDVVGERRQVGVLLPYAAVLVALVIGVVWHARAGHGDAFVAWSRSVLIVLIVCRQLLTLLENRGLTRHLEARVAARTAELYASAQRFRALVQQSSDVVTVVDPAGVVLYQSESIERVFGYPAAVLAGRNLTELLNGESGARLAAALRALAGRPAGTTVLELAIRRHDGRIRQAEVTITNLLAEPSVGGLVLNSRDISERKELQDQLVHEAYHDALTGLANRVLFHEQVDAALRRSRRTDGVTVLFLDLDGFKEVNDSLGHAAGDQLLVLVADRLRASVRAGDVVARFGGDEFAVLIESVVATADAEAVARRIVAGLHEPFDIDSRDIHVQASIGLASVGDAGDAEQLMRNADLAMYRAKAAGGGSYASYDPSMLTGLVERLELESDLRQALSRDELALHYQPTIDLADGSIVGFEALVRWQHPERGLISPADFIPIAEATGLIVPLGRWVLTEATRQAAAWAALGGGRPLTMNVNVSVRQFDRSDLPAVVAEVLAETGLPAAQLCLEMTESVLMTDTEDNLEQLIRLKQLGVCLAIDDFGTGYSSLAYLRRFPVDTLKIDRSFVERICEQREDAALVSTIVQLSRSLGMSTVAEGIETSCQLQALREIGCELAQGFHFSRPVPAPEAARLLVGDAVRVTAADALAA